MGKPVSIASQIAEVDHWAKRLRSRGFGDKPAVRELHQQYTEAVRETLVWLQQHEAAIRAFLAMAPEVRAAVVAHGPIVTALSVELAKRDAIADAGGPTR